MIGAEVFSRLSFKGASAAVTSIFSRKKSPDAGAAVDLNKVRANTSLFLH